jgi:predicted dehydrogenase
MYKIGIIGTSWAAKSPIPTFKSYKGVEVTAICSGNIKNAIACAKQFNIPNVEKNYLSLCARKDLDIIYIGSPVHMHSKMFLKAAKSNKHIICEKPLALNAQEGQAMLNAVNKYKITSIAAFTMRHFASHQLMKDLIAQGKIGEPIHLSINDFRGIPASKTLPAYRWWFQKNKGGGILGAMGSHFIDLARFMVDDFDSVYGTLGSINKQAIDKKKVIKKITADDIFSLNGQLKSNTSVSINCSIATNTKLGSNRNITIYGTAGTLVLDGDELSPNGVKLLFSSNKSSSNKEIKIPSIKMSASARKSTVPRFGLMIDKLISGINGEKQSPDILDGLKCQKVIDAVHLSNKSGITVKIK